MAVNLTASEIQEVFGSEDPNKHADEVQQRWGGTDAYRESERRTSSYSKADWEKAKAEGEAVVEQFRAALTLGLAADSPEALAAAEAHRKNISDWYYPCGYEMQVNLAAMYLADPRFTAYYDDFQPGLAQFVHDAILANAVDKI